MKWARWQSWQVPELPEVTALAAALQERTRDQLVTRVDVAAINALKTFDPPASALAGCLVVQWGRRGKFLVMSCVDGDGELIHLVIHLARGGWIRWRDDPPAQPPGLSRGGSKAPGLAVRVSFADDSGALVGAMDITEAGTQKRLACYIVRDPADVPGIASLGPEPLDEAFTPGLLHEILAAAGRSQLKGVLRDQSRIAGIGNAYSDEILHAARLSPYAPAGALGAGEERLYEAIGQTLRAACEVAARADPTTLKAEKKAAMAVHGRTGQPCPTCGDTVREVSFADSAMQYCPTCQTAGKVLADRRMSRLLK